jgi:hypothetical protein
MAGHEARFSLFRLTELLAEVGQVLLVEGIPPDEAVDVQRDADALRRRITGLREATAARLPAGRHGALQPVEVASCDRP